MIRIKAVDIEVDTYAIESKHYGNRVPFMFKIYSVYQEKDNGSEQSMSNIMTACMDYIYEYHTQKAQGDMALR